MTEFAFFKVRLVSWLSSNNDLFEVFTFFLILVKGTHVTFISTAYGALQFSNFDNVLFYLTKLPK